MVEPFFSRKTWNFVWTKREEPHFSALTSAGIRKFGFRRRVSGLRKRDMSNEKLFKAGSIWIFKRKSPYKAGGLGGHPKSNELKYLQDF